MGTPTFIQRNPAKVSFSPFAQDALAWLTAIPLAQLLRFEFRVEGIDIPATVTLMVLAVVLQWAIGSAFHLYQERYPYGTFEELQALAFSVLLVFGILAVPTVFFGVQLGITRSTMFIAMPLALIIMGSTRYMKRVLHERKLRPADETSPIIVYGAGYMGTHLINRMITDPEGKFKPVALLDDDLKKKNRYIKTVPVVGDLTKLAQTAEETGAKHLVVAISRADSKLLRAVADASGPLDIEVKVLPPLQTLLSTPTGLGDLRSLSIEDLIGRQPVDTAIDEIAGYLTGKRVLVTGAGGSIGSELCNQIKRFGPSQLMMLDRDETGLQGVQLRVQGNGLLDTPDVVLADIRDQETLTRIFEERQPEVVFHAAALKHLPMLEQYPREAWKTNVLGSLNVLKAAESVGVDTFVNISTDKAADPTSVLGHSKKVAERLTASFARTTGKRYLSVRFGNVIGSRGSMLPTFMNLIENGGPITVTHPDVTRYFMTIPEACQLVVQAGAIGRPGEVLILDMGEPIKILDIAKRMIEMSRKHVEIVFTGLREGEKLHEILTSEGEGNEHPFHPKVAHAQITELAPDELDEQKWLRHIHKADAVAAN